MTKTDVIALMHDKFKAEFPNMYIEGKNTCIYSFYVMCSNALHIKFYDDPNITLGEWYDILLNVESISHWCVENLDFVRLGK